MFLLTGKYRILLPTPPLHSVFCEIKLYKFSELTKLYIKPINKVMMRELKSKRKSKSNVLPFFFPAPDHNILRSYTRIH